MLADELIEWLEPYKGKNMEVFAFDEDGNKALVVDLKEEKHRYKTQGVHPIIRLIMEA